MKCDMNVRWKDWSSVTDAEAEAERGDKWTSKTVAKSTPGKNVAYKNRH